jgi:hypothetical protein
MAIPLNILFWGMEAAYIIHCLDETVTGEGFVNMVRKQFWSNYNGRMFFGFNTLLHVVNILGIILFEILGGGWVIWPLAMSWMFVTNGLWHLMGTFIFKEYSPGLMTSLLYWIVMYFIIRYSLIPGDIVMWQFIVSLIIGLILTILMIGSLFLQKHKNILSSR